MATKQEILELRNKNNGYEANLITLRQQKQKTSEIQFLEGRISANDRLIEEKEKQITLDKQISLEQIRLERTKNQGKSAASTDSL
jgi:hypothetical protein